jgi:transcriptional regulator with XRE-family HTH domain
VNRAERKRHEEAGWQVGSVADFLGITEEEAVYIDLRVRLADALKARRQAARLSQKAFASARKSSQSRIAKAEANDPSVSLDLVIRSLIALGVNLGELASIIVDENRSTVSGATADSKTERKEQKEPGKGHKRNSVKAA